jgi:hypothetical protein
MATSDLYFYPVTPSVVGLFSTTKRGAGTVIDTNFVEEFLSYNWSFDGDGRLQTKLRNKNTRVHEIVLGYKTNRYLVIDHKNGLPFDNRLVNLQVTSQAFNLLKMSKKTLLPLGVTHQGASFQSTLRLKNVQIAFGAKDPEYLANLVYSAYTLSGLATPAMFHESYPRKYKLLTEFASIKHETKFNALVTGLTEHVKGFPPIKPINFRTNYLQIP